MSLRMVDICPLLVLRSAQKAQSRSRFRLFWNPRAVRQQSGKFIMLKYATSRCWGGPRPGFGPQPRRTAVERPDVLRWYCVRTDFGAETKASIEIGLAGFQGFAPTVWKPAVPARRDSRGAIRPARPDRVEPMFHRYQFVGFKRSDNWQIVRGLPGVDCILGTAADMPSAMPDSAIEAIWVVCQANGCSYPEGVDLLDLQAPIPHKVGSVLRLVGGVLSDHDLTGICEWSSAARVRLLLRILGRDVRVTVPWLSAEAAEPVK